MAVLTLYLEQDAFFFSFSVSLLMLYFNFLSWLAFEAVTSMYPTGKFLLCFLFFSPFKCFYAAGPHANEEIIFRMGRWRNAKCFMSNLHLTGTSWFIWWAVVSISLSNNCTNPCGHCFTETLEAIFMNWYELWIQKKKLHNYKGRCFRWSVISFDMIVLIFINMCANCIICKEKWILIFKPFCRHMTCNVNASCS